MFFCACFFVVEGLLMKNKVYIAEITTILPHLFSSSEVVDILYPKSIDNGRPHRFARRSVGAVGITYRPTILSRDAFPNRALATPEYHPLEWGSRAVEELLKDGCVSREDVGFLSIAYNIRCDKDVLPSLSSKIASKCALKLDYPPQEMAYLGCAAGLFSLESSVKYCAEHNKAAITFLFDQCSWIVNPTYDVDDPEFKENLKTTLLFADGAAGILVIPENLRDKFDLPLMEVDEIITDFVSGGSLSMHEGKLVLEDKLKDTVPEIVHNHIIKPLGVTPENIDEWSLHQGGMPILMRFTEPEILGLNEEQISRSKSIFQKYGNFSSPSVMFVLETWFKDASRPLKDEKTRGCAISFGAGYFMGGMTYHWSKK